jgi:hypothetical protein
MTDPHLVDPAAKPAGRRWLVTRSVLGPDGLPQLADARLMTTAEIIAEAERLDGPAPSTVEEQP